MNEVITQEDRNLKFVSLAQEVAVKLQAKATKLAIDIMQSYPEYSSDWIRCCAYDYGMDEKMEKQLKPAQYTFKVEDPDSEGKFITRVVSPEEVAAAIPQLWMMVTAEKIFLCGLSDTNFWDPCSWDSEASDALLQLYFYGETVFG
jgi:hypothetical protein